MNKLTSHNLGFICSSQKENNLFSRFVWNSNTYSQKTLEIDTTATNLTRRKYIDTEVKVSRNGPERRSGKRIIAGTAFRLEFLVRWYYDADATMAVPELY